MITTPTGRLYSKNEAGEILNLKESTIRTYVSNGTIRGHKIGRTYYVSDQAICDYIESTVVVTDES